VAQLQVVLSKLPRDEAAHHLDRCIKSGLWVPNAKDAAGGGDEETNDDEEDNNEEKVSEDVEKKPVEQ
jgi:cell division cycle protein 37